jgi:ubiquinone/menaquinone biosynthesis C-methylase UbiE
MVRTLGAQAVAIWPQELPLLKRYALPASPAVLDAGCGTGEASLRIAEALPTASVLGVDIVDAHLDLARARTAHLGGRARFEHRSVYDLGLALASFDLVVCRHVLHAIPHPDRVIAELVRVTRPGGTVHLIAEDYGMIHFPKRRFDPRRFWPDLPLRYGEKTETDLLVGRHAPAILRALGLEDITADYVVVDTLRVDREVFASIWQAWLDGYSGVLSELLGVSLERAREEWDDQIATIRDPASYAAWIVPVIAGRVPR